MFSLLSIVQFIRSMSLATLICCHTLKLFSVLQLILLLWSYSMVVCKDPGSVPENWKPVHEQENLEAGSSITFHDHVANEALDSTSDGVERRPQLGYCSRCQNGKPPRCHHCTICKQLCLYIVLRHLSCM